MKIHYILVCMFFRFLYVAMTLFMVIYLIVEVAFKTPENLRSLMGLFVYPLFLFLISNNKRKVSTKMIVYILIQDMSLFYIPCLLNLFHIIEAPFLIS